MLPAPPHGLRRYASAARRRLASLLLLSVVTASAAVGANEAPPLVRLETTLGDIVLELDERRAPRTVENFLDYVDDGFYDGTVFHRVIEGFMVQGGGFDAGFSRKATRPPIRNEANNGLANRRYTIAMARTNAPHSATAQFFINTVDNPNLDHAGATPRGWGYAVFGRVVDGHDVVDAISAVPTGAGGPFSRDVPGEPVAIVAASRVVPAGDGDAPGDGAPADPPASALPDDGETTSAASEGTTESGEPERSDPL